MPGASEMLNLINSQWKISGYLSGYRMFLWESSGIKTLLSTDGNRNDVSSDLSIDVYHNSNRRWG